MTTRYKVRAFSAQAGSVVVSIVEAMSAREAHAQAEGSGLTVLEVHPVKTIGAIWRRPTRFEIGVFCSELRMLLRAGMGVVEAIETLQAKTEDALVRSTYAQLHQRLLEGRTLATALSLQPDVFPPILVAAVQSSEKTGRIAEALGEFASYYQLLSDLKRKVGNAAVYPLLVTGFGFVVAVFLLFYVIPRFASVYEGLGPNPSLPAKILLLISHHLAAFWPLWLGVTLSAAGALSVLWIRGVLSRWFVRVSAALPWVDRHLRLFQLVQIYRSLAMLCRGGFTLLDALRLAQPQAFQLGLKVALADASAALAEGRQVSQALQDTGVTDAVSLRLLRAGERSGEMAPVFDAIAEEYSTRLGTAIERAMRLAEPVLMIFVGGMIGALVVLMYMPVFDLAGAINP